MKKAELISIMADSAEITKRTAEIALESCLLEMKRGLLRGDEVKIAGFGTFTLAKRAAREGRNPQTGKKIKIKAKKVVKFKAGSRLKEMVK